MTNEKVLECQKEVSIIRKCYNFKCKKKKLFYHMFLKGYWPYLKKKSLNSW
jgi:hypothetical protein